MKNLTRRGFIGVAATAGMAAALTGCASGSGSAASASSASASAASTSASAASASASAAAAGGSLRFVTGGEAGTYYAFGSVIAQHATNNAGVEVTALVGNGSQANVAELEDGNAELAFCQSDVATYAYEGTNLFEESGKVECFSTVGVLYDEQVQIVTCDPEIKSVADLAGKNVSIGAAGSGVYFNALDALEAYGMTEGDIKPTYQSFKDSTDSLIDGKIDAAFVVAGAPTTSITELSTSKQAYLVGFDDEHIDALLAKSPFYSKNVIAAGTYKGIDEDVTTVAVPAVILAADSVSEDDVYAFTADIFDNAPNLTESHAKYAELSVEKGASFASVPYHPGAAKYFGEKGIAVATK